MAKISVLIDVDEEQVKGVSGDASLEDAITRELDWLRDSGMKVEAWKMAEAEHSKQNEKLELDLGFAKIVAEKGHDSEFPEVYVYLVDGENVIIQDLAVIGRNYHVEQGKIIDEDNINVRVYSDKDNEDYTHSFVVDVYEPEKGKISLNEKMEHAKGKTTNGSCKEQEHIR